MRKRSGIGLTILVALIAIAGLMVLGSTRVMENMARQMQLRIDQTRAHYLAQAGAMQSIYNWRVSNAAEMSRSYDDINTTVTGNLIFKTLAQANFAYFSFNSTDNAVWANVGGNDQLQLWRLKNIHVAEAGTADNLVLSRVKVSWSPAGGGNLRRIQLNVGGGSTVVLAVGSYANGADTALSATYTLTPGQTTQSVNTFLEWVGAQPATLVTVQWTCNDNSATVESKTHEVVYWNGAQAAGAGRPTMHSFSVASSGQVNQTLANYFKVMKTVKATVAGQISPAEITDWDEVDKNVP